MAVKVIVIGVLLIIAAFLLVTKPVQAKKSSDSESSQSDVAGDFPCLDNELESCRLKRKTLSRLRVSLEDLRNIDNQGECQDRCESAVGKKGKRLEQCMCLCNYYNVCLGSIGDNGSGTAGGSGIESTKTKSESKSKSGKSKKSRSKTEGSGGELGNGEEISKSKNGQSKAKTRKSKK